MFLFFWWGMLFVYVLVCFLVCFAPVCRLLLLGLFLLPFLLLLFFYRKLFVGVVVVFVVVFVCFNDAYVLVMLMQALKAH